MRRLFLLAVFVVAAALPVAAQQASRIGTTSLNSYDDYRLDSGLSIDADIHARVFWKGNPYVQIGYSNLVWTSFMYEGRTYSRSELVSMFGSEVPDATITNDGTMTLEFPVGLEEAAYGVHWQTLALCFSDTKVQYNLSLQLGRREKMGTDLAGALMSEYTGTLLHDYSGADRTQRVKECVEDLDRSKRSAEVWQATRASIGFVEVVHHYFPASKRTLTTIEDHLAALLGGRANDERADRDRADRSSGQSRSDRDQRDEREEEEDEEKKYTPPHIKHLALAQRFEQMGNYVDALRQYEAYCSFPQAICDQDKRSYLARKANGQRVEGLQRTLIDAEVSRPYERPGFITDLNGTLGFLDYGDVGGGITFGVGGMMSHRFRNHRPTAILVEAEADGRLGVPVMADMVGVEPLDPELCGGDCAPDEAESWSTLGGRLGAGIDWRGMVALTYDLHARNFSAAMPDHVTTVYGGEDMVWQEGLSLTVGMFEERESEMSLRVRSTGQLFMGARTTDGPALSFISYELTMGFNQLTMRLGYQTFEFDPGPDASPLSGSAFVGTMGMRLQ